MNKSIRCLFFILFFQLVLSFSCVQDYTLTDDLGMQQEVIVNGILVQDSVPVIYLHRSASFRAEGDFELVDNASVKLYYRPMGLSEGELIEENLVFQDSYYKSDVVLLADYEYHLEVLLADGSLLEASTYIPDPHRISSTRIVSPAGFAETPNVSGPFSRIEITVDAGKRNEKSYFEVYNYALLDSAWSAALNPDYQQLEYTFFRTWNEDGLILREALPESENYAFLFHLGPSDDPVVLLSFDFLTGPNPFSSEFYPVLNTVSEDYFLYKKSLYTHLESLSFSYAFDLPDLYTPSIFKLLQPVYSNIKGGRGIFAGISSDEMKTTCNIVGFTCD